MSHPNDAFASSLRTDPTHSPSASNTPSASATPSGSTVLVADAKPLSLLATAGVLHHAGMRCVCARTADAVKQACGVTVAPTTESRRVDEPVTGPPASGMGGQLSGQPGKPAGIDLIVWEVGDEVALVLQTLAEIRQRLPDLPAVLIASSKWAGLEKKTENLNAPTRCLFQPIDPGSLVAVCEPLLWMPALQSIHRQRGSRPSRPGWVTL